MYYKNFDEDYIKNIGISQKEIELPQGFSNISEEEYLEILKIINAQPQAPEGFMYKLKTDLTWELCEPPITEEMEDMITDG